MKQDKLAHVKTEFGFDVLEVARGRYAPDSYHDFIGFGVSSSATGTSLPGNIRLGSEKRSLERREGHRFVPSRCQPASSQSDAHCLESEERRNHEGSARHDEKEVSLQSFSRQLPEELGKAISAAYLWRKDFLPSWFGFSPKSVR